MKYQSTRGYPFDDKAVHVVPVETERELLIEALRAISARVDGRFDDPALVKFGPLAGTEDDVALIANTILAKVEKRP